MVRLGAGRKKKKKNEESCAQRGRDPGTQSKQIFTNELEGGMLIRIFLFSFFLCSLFCSTRDVDDNYSSQKENGDGRNGVDFFWINEKTTSSIRLDFDL